jgi:hypothetical protein
MRHATGEGLQPVAALLERIRLEPRLKERRCGTFYVGGNAFLHFHEGPQGLFADLRAGADWERHPVNDPAQQEALLARIGALVGGFRQPPYTRHRTRLK